MCGRGGRGGRGGAGHYVLVVTVAAADVGVSAVYQAGVTGMMLIRTIGLFPDVLKK